MNPLRILMVTEASGGGSGRHVLDLSEGLIARGCDVHLIYSPHRVDRFFRERLSQSGAPPHALCPMGRTIHPGDLSALRWICGYVRDFGPFDIVHGHSAKGRAGLALRRLASGTPTVYTTHGFILMDPGVPSRKRLFYHAGRMGPWLCDGSDHRRFTGRATPRRPEGDRRRSPRADPQRDRPHPCPASEPASGGRRASRTTPSLSASSAAWSTRRRPTYS